MVSNGAYDRIEREIHEFQRKLHQCGSSFSVSDFRARFAELKALPGSKNYPRIFTVGALRKLLVELLQDTSEESKNETHQSVTVYFQWFMEYWEYLKSLRSKFVKRIHEPLYQYFYDNGMLTPALLTPSLDSDPERPPSTNAHGDVVCSATSASRHLNLLQNQYENARHLFDGRDIKVTATQLQQNVTELEWLLQDDRDLSRESSSEAQSGSSMTPGGVNRHKRTSDSTTEPQGSRDVLGLCRLVCDVLAKFQSAALLAREWVSKDRVKDEDLVNQLEHIKQVSKTVDTKLSELGQHISLHQDQLEREAADLQYLLKREDRSNDLQAQLHQTEKDIAGLTESLDLARQERDLLAKQYLKAGELDPNNAIALKIKYDQNRLKRYVLKRYMAAKQYKLALLQDDLHLECNMKSNFVQYTNNAQDKYEKLEQTVQKEKQRHKLLKQQSEELRQQRLMLQEEALNRTLMEATAPEEEALNNSVREATAPESSEIDSEQSTTDSAKPSKIPVRKQKEPSKLIEKQSPKKSDNVWNKALIPVELWEKRQRSMNK